MSLANFIKSAATQLDEVATWLLGKISSLSFVWFHNSCQLHLFGGGLSAARFILSSTSPVSCHFLSRCFAFALSLSLSFCLSTSASTLVINQLVALLTSCRIIFSRCKLTLDTHTHTPTHTHIAEASSCQCLGLSLVCCARFSTHHFLC